MNAFPARPTIPSRPAVYVRDPYATAGDGTDMTQDRNMVVSVAQNELGWPEPAVYADAGPPGGQLPLLGWTPSDQSSALPVAAVVRSWEDRFGARLLEIGYAEIRLLVQRPPRSLKAARQVAAEHWAFADEYDDIGQAAVGDIAAALLRQPALWQFWWD